MSSADKDLYLSVSYQLAEQLTAQYSTSFTKAIRFFRKDRQRYVYALYGMVRLADEIVDAGFSIETEKELANFELQVKDAVAKQYSSNPVLHAYQDAVHRFSIPNELAEAFFVSMRMDISKKRYSQEEYETYIYGSAEVVGLMCLCVFVDGDTKRYERLKKSAALLGSAFQKVNFLRDIQADYSSRGRIYFPGIDIATFTDVQKQAIEAEIAKELADCKPGILELPRDVRRAVLAAHAYFSELLRVIEMVPASKILSKRMSVSPLKKAAASLRVYLPR